MAEGVNGLDLDVVLPNGSVNNVFGNKDAEPVWFDAQEIADLANAYADTVAAAAVATAATHANSVASTAQTNAIAAIPAIASQAQAEAGTNNTTMMTPLRGAQQLAALGGGMGSTALSTSPKLIIVDDFYPDGVTPGSTATPDSLGYFTIEDYIAECPAALQDSFSSFADSPPLKTDTCDALAMTAASNWLIDTFGGGYGGNVLFSAAFYRTNKTITWNGVSPYLFGNPNSRFGGTNVGYVGPDGTLDENIFIFDFYNYDEFGYASRDFNVSTAGTAAKVYGITFRGKGGSMSSANQNVSGYISGIRIRANYHPEISWCGFVDTLYDGIVITGPALFPRIFDCFFYGCHRDGIASWAYYQNYGTTQVVERNYFGFVGRMAINFDLRNAIQPRPIFRDNVLEHAFSTSFYMLHPEWFPFSIKCGCFFGWCGNILIEGTYHEAVTEVGNNYVGYLFTVSSPLTVRNDGVACICFANPDQSAVHSDAATAYQAVFKTVTGITKANPAVVTSNGHGYANGATVHIVGGNMTQVIGPPHIVANATANTFELQGVNSTAYTTFGGSTFATDGHMYSDITDARNLQLGRRYTVDGGQYQRCYLGPELQNLSLIFFTDGCVLDQTLNSEFRSISFGVYEVEARKAAARTGLEAVPFTSAVFRYGLPIYGGFPQGEYYNCVVGGKIMRDLDHYTVVSAGTAWSAGATATATATHQTGGWAFPNHYIRPTDAHFNGYFYECVIPGTTGGSEPTWLAGPKDVRVTGISKAATMVITAPSHGLSNGDKFIVRSSYAMTQVNYVIYTATNVTTDTIDVAVNSSAYTTFTGDAKLDSITEDNGVGWRRADRYYSSDEDGQEEVHELGRRKIRTFSGAAPSGMRAHDYGDEALIRIPDSTTKRSWVCTAPGIPGTWKAWGPIDA